MSKEVEQLPKRLLDVLRGIGEAKPTKIIAAELGISEQTVLVHRRRLYSRLRAHSQSEVVRIALAASASLMNGD